MNNDHRTCQTCTRPLNPASRSDAKYCSKRCRNRAQERRKRGTPPQDSGSRPEQYRDLINERNALLAENRKLRRHITVLTRSRNRHRDENRNTQRTTEAVRNRNRSDLDAARIELRNAKAESAEYRSAIEQLSRRNRGLLAKLAEYDQYRAARNNADAAALEMSRKLRVQTQLLKDYSYLANQYFTIKVKHRFPWSQIDRNVQKRFLERVRKNR